MLTRSRKTTLPIAATSLSIPKTKPKQASVKRINREIPVKVSHSIKSERRGRLPHSSRSLFKHQRNEEVTRELTCKPHFECRAYGPEDPCPKPCSKPDYSPKQVETIYGPLIKDYHLTKPLEAKGYGPRTEFCDIPPGPIGCPIAVPKSKPYILDKETLYDIYETLLKRKHC